MIFLTHKFSIALLVVLLLAISYCEADTLPPCDEIPKLLCCTDRVLEKCLAGCVDHVSKKCPHKLQKFDTIEEAKKITEVALDAAPERQVEPKRRPESGNTVHEAVLPEAPRRNPARAHGAVSGVAPKPSGGRPKQFADLPQEGFIEQSAPVPSSGSGFRGSSSGGSRSGGDYDQLNPQYPVTEVTDRDLSPECGTAKSRPPFSPCIGRKAVDDLFLSCCRQHVPPSCHAICTYEHREHVAAETLIAAVQSDGCDLRYLSSVLYCANQNRDNRECCEHLSLASPTLGVGERCLRMCNIARSGQTLGTVEKNDLVCLSNWNVIMYCARAGLRTIN